MKSIRIMFILLIAAFGMLSVLAQTEEVTSQNQQQQQQQMQNLYPDYPEKPQTVTQEPTRITTTETEEQLIADPNKIVAKIQGFEGLKEALEQVENQSQEEERTWLQTRTDNRTILARTVHRQIVAELIFLRKLAEQEKAEKTIAAIDGLLLDRHERLEYITGKLEEEKKELRQQQNLRRTPYNPRQRSLRSRVPRNRMDRENQQSQEGNYMQ